MKRIGMRDRFGTSGNGLELLEYFGLDSKNIVLAVHELLAYNSKRKSVG
jgi:transketolase C-terminal domain/subunit